MSCRVSYFGYIFFLTKNQIIVCDFLSNAVLNDFWRHWVERFHSWMAEVYSFLNMQGCAINDFFFLFPFFFMFCLCSVPWPMLITILGELINIWSILKIKFVDFNFAYCRQQRAGWDLVCTGKKCVRLVVWLVSIVFF